MIKNKKTGLFIVLLAFIISMLSFNIFAKDNTLIFDSKVYERSYISVKNDITIPFIKLAQNDITYNDDINKFGISLAQSKINVKGTMNKIQLMVSKEINIEGSIKNAVIIGMNVNISGSIGDDVIIIADHINISEGAIINSDIIVCAESLSHNGAISGSLIGNINNIELNGNIKEDLRVNAGSINFKNELIQGDILVKSTNNIVIPSKYTSVNMIIVDDEDKYSAPTFISIVLSALFNAVLFACLYYLINAIYKNKLSKTSTKVKNNLLAVILSGVFTLFMLPVEILIFICLSIIAWPVVIPLFIIYIAFVIVSMLLAIFITGSFVHNIVKDKIVDKTNKNKNVLDILILIAIYFILALLCSLRYVGAYIYIINLVFAMGIILIDLFKRSDSKK